MKNATLLMCLAHKKKLCSNYELNNNVSVVCVRVDCGCEYQIGLHHLVWHYEKWRISLWLTVVASLINGEKIFYHARKPKWLSTCSGYLNWSSGVVKWNESSCYMQFNCRFFNGTTESEHRQSANANLNLKNGHFNL